MPDPLSDADLARLRAALPGLAQGRSGPLDRARLVELAHLGAPGTRLPIDLEATETLGAPLVVVQPAPARPAPCFDALSPRQREVAALVATGLRNQDVALALGISVGTVKDHVHAILSRTGLDSRAAVAAAWRGPNGTTGPAPPPTPGPG